MEKRTTATIEAMATTIFLKPISINFSEVGLVLSENFDVLALSTRKSNLNMNLYLISNFSLRKG